MDFVKNLRTAKGKLLSELESVRGKIQAVKEERDWMQNAPLPKNEAIEKLYSYVDAQSERFDAPGRLENVLRPGGAAANLFVGDGQIDHGREVNGVVLGSTSVDLAPALAWFIGADALKARLADEIHSLDYQEGPPAHERASLTKDLDKELLELERKEEVLIDQAAEMGFAIERRADADPRAILEYED